MRLSISTFLYFNYTIEETVKRISQNGYQGIEIWGGRPHVYRKDLSDEELTNLRSLIEESGLEISAFIPAQFRYPSSLCSPNEKVREDSVSYIKDSIITSDKLGCHKVSICPGHTLCGQGYENGVMQLRKSVQELHDFAHKKDVILFVEPAHRFESDLILTIKEGIDFISELDLDNLGIVMDTGHCHVNNESLTECISLLSNTNFHIHIDDNHGESDDHKIPGEGNINFLPFLKELKGIGYKGYLTVELGWNYTQEPDKAALKSREEIESVLKKS